MALKLFGAEVSSPRDELRYFIIAAEDEAAARWAVKDRIDYEVCSIQVVSVECLLGEFDGCAEILA